MILHSFHIDFQIFSPDDLKWPIPSPQKSAPFKGNGTRKAYGEFCPPFCLLFDILFVQTTPSMGPAASLTLALSDFSLEDACCNVSTQKVQLIDVDRVDCVPKFADWIYATSWSYRLVSPLKSRRKTEILHWNSYMHMYVPQWTT